MDPEDGKKKGESEGTTGDDGELENGLDESGEEDLRKKKIKILVIIAILLISVVSLMFVPLISLA